MAFSNRVLTTTQDKLVPKVVDTILNSNVFASRMLSRAKKWSGETMKFPIKFQKNSTGTSFNGYDTFSTAGSDTRVRLSFDPKFQQITVSLPLSELSVNATEERVLDLMALEMQSSAQDMADDIGTSFFGDGTGNSSKDFLGLGAIVDDGTSVATYGGLSRSTYTTLASTVTASSGTISLAKMATLYNAVTSGSMKPTLGVTTEAVWALIEQLIQPQERIVKDVGMTRDLVLNTGATGLTYKGFPIVADEKCTSGVLFFLNEDFIDFYAQPLAMTEPAKFKSQDIQGNDYSSVMGLGFTWGGWVKPTNAAAVVGHVYIGGELVGTNPKRQGKLTGITSV